jgi:hypothetical protein
MTRRDPIALTLAAVALALAACSGDDGGDDGPKTNGLEDSGTIAFAGGTVDGVAIDSVGAVAPSP